jgi:hypothetical protein
MAMCGTLYGLTHSVDIGIIFHDFKPQVAIHTDGLSLTSINFKNLT